VTQEERPLTSGPSDARVRALTPIVRGLAEMLGPDCEVLLYDLGGTPSSIVAVENGILAERAIEEAPARRTSPACRRADEVEDVRLTLSAHDGRIVKSLAVTLRDADGEPFALLGVSLDVSAIVQAQRALADVAAPFLSRDREAGDASDLLRGGIRDVIDAMIGSIVAEKGKPPSAMSRDEKMQVVRQLEGRGAFLVKRAAEQVADALDLSRYTIFSYLKEIRQDEARARPAPGDRVRPSAGRPK